VGSEREQSLFQNAPAAEALDFAGVVNLPEFLSKTAELNSDHVPTEMLLAYERYADR